MEEYEDAAAGHGKAGRFAVADGATESAFAGPWAKALAEAFVKAPVGPGGWPRWLPPVQRRWLKEIGGQELPWYLEEKFQQGAFATLLGVELQPGERAWEWRSVSVGDCCLFHVRGDSLLCSFPIERSTDFGSKPELLCSRSANGDRPEEQRAKGRARPGDSFVLLTDAIAQWALRREEAKWPPWSELRGLAAESLPPWIEARWEAKELRADDVTLLFVDLPAAEGRA